MHKLQIGDVTIASIIERDGPWRPVENMFPTCDLALARKHLTEMEPFVWDAASGKLLWSFYARNGILSTPISYMVRGRQYVTVIAAFGGPPAALGTFVAKYGGWDYRDQERRVLTFALDGKARLPHMPPPTPAPRRDRSPTDRRHRWSRRGNAGGRCRYRRALRWAGPARAARRTCVTLNRGPC